MILTYRYGKSKFMITFRNGNLLGESYSENLFFFTFVFNSKNEKDTSDQISFVDTESRDPDNWGQVKVCVAADSI